MQPSRSRVHRSSWRLVIHVALAIVAAQIFGVPAVFTGEGSTLDARGPSVPSDADCLGTDIHPGDELVEIVNEGEEGETFCIHAGTYDIGTANLEPRAGQSFVGDPVQIGPAGEVYAETVIRGSDTDGVFNFVREANGVRFENLDISGAIGERDRDDVDTKKYGRGINGNSYEPVITVRYSRIHHNSNSGIGGIGAGTLIDAVELDHNGSETYLGCCAGGVKSGNSYTIRNSYVHDNVGYGIWCDLGCEGGLWEIVGNTVTGNTVDGIRFEVSMNDHGAVIKDNVVQGNNTSLKTGGHGGIAIVSSWNVLVTGNVLGDNGNYGIDIHNDARGSIRNITVEGNEMNGDDIKGCDLGNDVFCG